MTAILYLSDNLNVIPGYQVSAENNLRVYPRQLSPIIMCEQGGRSSNMDFGLELDNILHKKFSKSHNVPRTFDFSRLEKFLNKFIKSKGT